MDKTPIKIFCIRDEQMPSYATKLSAGVDLRAYLPEGNVVLKPLERKLIPTGIHIQLPAGYEAQVRPRSGLAARFGITVLNTPGTIDADYTGEIKVILVNLSDKDFLVTDKERIAQMVISKHETADFIPVVSIEEFEKTERGAGGFGHTGTE